MHHAHTDVLHGKCARARQQSLAYVQRPPAARRAERRRAAVRLLQDKLQLQRPQPPQGNGHDNRQQRPRSRQHTAQRPALQSHGQRQVHTDKENRRQPAGHRGHRQAARPERRARHRRHCDRGWHRQAHRHRRRGPLQHKRRRHGRRAAILVCRHEDLQTQSRPQARDNHNGRQHPRAGRRGDNRNAAHGQAPLHRLGHHHRRLGSQD